MYNIYLGEQFENTTLPIGCMDGIIMSCSAQSLHGASHFGTQSHATQEASHLDELAAEEARDAALHLGADVGGRAEGAQERERPRTAQVRRQQVQDAAEREDRSAAHRPLLILRQLQNLRKDHCRARLAPQRQRECRQLLAHALPHQLVRVLQHPK